MISPHTISHSKSGHFTIYFLLNVLAECVSEETKVTKEECIAQVSVKSCDYGSMVRYCGSISMTIWKRREKVAKSLNRDAPIQLM